MTANKKVLKETFSRETVKVSEDTQAKHEADKN